MLFIVGACSSNTNEDKSNKQQNVNETTQLLKKGYAFKIGGCDTGHHEFAAENEQDLQGQLCTALQDDTLNRGCARDKRQQLFAVECSGFQWKLKNPVATPQSPDKTTSFDNVSPLIITALQYALVKSHLIQEGLSEEHKTVITQLLDQLSSCGFSYRGSNCVDADAIGYRNSGFANPAGGFVFITRLEYKDLKPVFFVFDVAKFKPAVEIQSLKIYKALEVNNHYDVSALIGGSKTAVHLADVEVLFAYSRNPP